MSKMVLDVGVRSEAECDYWIERFESEKDESGDLSPMSMVALYAMRQAKKRFQTPERADNEA